MSRTQLLDIPPYWTLHKILPCACSFDVVKLIEYVLIDDILENMQEKYEIDQKPMSRIISAFLKTPF